MDLKNIVKSDWMRVICTSILLIVITTIVSSLLSLRIAYTERTPDSSTIEIISFILAGIIVVALLNKAKSIKNSISRGATIGILAGIFYSVSLFTYFLYLQASNPETHYDGGFGLIIILSAFFTLFWLITSISGMLISYFIRKVMKKST